ncbi:MAG: hypothetical protein C0429_06845 [Sphingopyxis sp.]|nr:hypothetical protein [Sphingopyxis sp.]
MYSYDEKTKSNGLTGRRLVSSATPIPPIGRRPNPLTAPAEEAGGRGNPYWRFVQGFAFIVFVPIFAIEVIILLGWMA